MDTWIEDRPITLPYQLLTQPLHSNIHNYNWNKVVILTDITYVEIYLSPLSTNSVYTLVTWASLWISQCYGALQILNAESILCNAVTLKTWTTYIISSFVGDICRGTCSHAGSQYSIWPPIWGSRYYNRVNVTSFSGESVQVHLVRFYISWLKPTSTSCIHYVLLEVQTFIIGMCNPSTLVQTILLKSQQWTAICDKHMNPPTHLFWTVSRHVCKCILPIPVPFPGPIFLFFYYSLYYSTIVTLIYWLLNNLHHFLSSTSTAWNLWPARRQMTISKWIIWNTLAVHLHWNWQPIFIDKSIFDLQLWVSVLCCRWQVSLISMYCNRIIKIPIWRLPMTTVRSLKIMLRVQYWWRWSGQEISLLGY